jgi:hypothetical protein
MDSSKPKTAKAGSAGLATVTPVAESFAGRISRKLQEKRIAESREDQERTARYQRVLQGLAIVRRSFQEISAIVIDERFSLNLEVEDLNGWPKLTVYLSDRLEPNWKTLGLEAHAHDRHKTGLIEIRDMRGKVVLSSEAVQPAALDKLPTQLKKIVRAFLDMVEEEILNPRSPEELLSVQTKNLLSSELVAAPLTNGPAINVDVFSEGLPPPQSASSDAESGEVMPLSVDVFSKSDKGS